MTETTVLTAILAALIISYLIMELVDAIKQARQWKAENTRLCDRNAALHRQVEEMRAQKYPPLFGMDELHTNEQKRRWADHKTPRTPLKFEDGGAV